MYYILCECCIYYLNIFKFLISIELINGISFKIYIYIKETDYIYYY